MTLTRSNIYDIVEILDSEYYSMGITSGHEALANVLDDFLSGRLDGFLEEQGTNKHEFHKTIFWVLSKKWITEGKMWQDQKVWYELQKNYR
jgi:hypothetical protein